MAKVPNNDLKPPNNDLRSFGRQAERVRPALLRGREYAMPEDVRDLAPEVLRHRLLLSYEALAQDVTPEHLLQRLMEAVPVPKIHIGDPYGDSRASLEAPRV